LQQECIQDGFVVEAIENVPIAFYDKIMLGLPGRDEQLIPEADKKDLTIKG
jgi:mannonate dehydratase